MAAKKKQQHKCIKRPVNGVLLLDKPIGYSSNQALQKVKWLFQAAKAGHSGTLDPMATGVLPICLGEATKFAQYLTDAEKCYLAKIKLGVTTTTADAEGEVIEEKPVNVTQAQFIEAYQPLLGEIMQVPPMYSALKVDGKALYEYAREGVEIKRKARQVTIYSIDLENFEEDIATVLVRCSKGTYIRTLAEDIGKALGCGAHLAGLRRTATAGYVVENTITIGALEEMALAERDDALMPVDTAIQELPKVILDDDAAYYLRQGQAIWQSGQTPDGELRLYDEAEQFIGLGYLMSDGKIAPKRLVNLSS